jgi:hypothetical protein
LLSVSEENQSLIFVRKEFRLEYCIVAKQLKIFYIGAAVSLEMDFEATQVPRTVRNKLSLEILVLVLYHTLEDMYEFDINGRLIVQITTHPEALLL